MNPTIENIFATGTVLDGDDQPFQAFPTSIQYTEGQVLYRIVSQPHVQRTLEIGLAYGISTLFIAQALYDKQQPPVGEKGQPAHTAMDPLQAELWKNIGLANLKRAGLQQFLRFYPRPSSAVLPALVEDGEQFDFVFVDGAHFFDFALLDLWYANHLLNPGGLVMLHDMDWPPIRKLLAFVLRNYSHFVVDMTLAPAVGPVWRPYKNLARYLLQSPADFFGWALPLWKRHPELYTRNFCLLRKTGEDARSWHHYQSF